MHHKDRIVLALIPARGGSKGIPGKNIVLLGNRPLMQYTIDAAKACHSIDKVVVSTDDAEISAVAKQCGAHVIMRPDDLGRDESSIVDVVFHALDTLKAQEYVPDIVILLQPTSPMRTGEDIDRALELFSRSDTESVISVCEVEHSPYWDFIIHNDLLSPLFDANINVKRRQDLPKVFQPNGAIYIITPDGLRLYWGFITKRCRPYVMPRERSVDIDTPFDLFIAECFLTKGKNSPD